MKFPQADSRVSKWPLMGSPVPMVSISVSYLMFVTVLGPAFMRKRLPFDLRPLIVVYNFAMVAYNAWIFYKLGVHGWFGKYSLLCEPISFSTDEDTMQFLLADWHYVLSKVVELLDTVFFILRKKDKQLSFLHVSHHASVPLIAYFLMTHGSDGYNSIFAFLNTFVHIWMYLYYALSAVGPSMQKFLWWKKYLTTLQLIQFTLVMLFVVVHFLVPGCGSNPVLLLVNAFPAVCFFPFFLNFYRAAYRGKASAESTSDSVSQNGRHKDA